MPNQPEMGRDLNTRSWVQHLAFEVADEAALLAPIMLEEWSWTKRAPRHADWLHREPGTA